MSNIFENKGALAATIVVAASDSLNKNAANYVASGAADDVEINAALAACNGGEVKLLEGNYVTVANITVPADCKLSGMGFGTIITANHADITNAIVLNDRSTLVNLKVILAAGCGTAGARPNVVYAAAETQIWIQDVWIVGDETVDDDNDLRQNGIYFDTVIDSKIINCRIEDNKRHGIQLYDASDYNTVEGNTCEGNNRNGIFLLSSSVHNSITGNICQVNTTGIWVDGSNNNTITGNTCAVNAAYGIHNNTSDENVITGNQCDDNGLHGVYIYRSSYCTVTGNGCHNQDSGSGIYIEGDSVTNSDYNTVTGNVCTGNNVDGITILEGAPGGNANKNIVLGNSLLGNTGAALTDGGTNTEIGHNITV